MSELTGYLDGVEVGPEGRNGVTWARMVDSLVGLVSQMADRQVTEMAQASEAAPAG